MFCNNCGKEINDNAVMCPHCKKMIRSNNSQNQNNRKVAIGCSIIGLIFILILIGIISLTINTSENLTSTSTQSSTTNENNETKKCIPITMELYNKVPVGATVKTFQEKLGNCCGEISSESEFGGINTTMITFFGESLASSAVFILQNGTVESKSQFGLR